MQITSKQLEAHLVKHPLLPVYLIHGDVPLLVQETRDTIRKIAKKNGFLQAKILYADFSLNAHQLTLHLNNLQLFSEKIWVEIRNPKAKFDDAIKQILDHYLKNPESEKQLVIVTDKLTPAQQKTAWFKSIESAGLIITVWPLYRHELPNWIAMRFKQAGLTADTSSIQILADLTEGNLLATQQAIEILALLYPNGRITENAVAQLITDNTRFTIFDLSQQALAGNTKRCLEVLQSLKATGSEPVLILWSLVNEIRNLFPLINQLENGIPLIEILNRERPLRKPFVKQALSHLTSSKLQQSLLQAEQVDWIIKGMQRGNLWVELERLLLQVSSEI